MSIISMTEAERQELIGRLKRWLHAVRVADNYASGIGGISEKTDDDLHDLEFALEAEEAAKRAAKERERLLRVAIAKIAKKEEEDEEDD